jgi:hypothetical protein
MMNSKEIWPLAFMLAIGAVPSQADTPIDTNPASFFRAGSLAETLRHRAASETSDEKRSGISPAQLAQWFNFFNCFNGAWRRC